VILLHQKNYFNISIDIDIPDFYTLLHYSSHQGKGLSMVSLQIVLKALSQPFLHAF
jgi:hypothetical protein